MENLNSLNNIESYLTNKMSAAERKFFEAQLAKDPLLQNEINFHKDVIEGLQDYRKKELKERLNNIEVKGGNSYTGIKVAASVALATLIGLSSYYFTVIYNKEVASPQSYITPETKKEVSQEKSSNSLNSLNETNSILTPSETKVIRKEVAKPQKETSNVSAHIPIFNAPDVKEHFAEDDEQISHEEIIEASQGNITKAETPKLSSVEIKIEESKSNQLQYQHYNNKLFLYGDFNSKPYEILELNSHKESKLYIYFEEKYFALKPNQIKIANLEEIKNAKLIESLKMLRDK